MDDLIDRAEKLPMAARVIATTSFVRFLDEHPILRQVDPENWDFLICVSGVFVAVTSLEQDEKLAGITDSILGTLTTSASAVYPNIAMAVDNCREFVDRTYDGLVGQEAYVRNPQFLFADCVGSWVVWNLVDHAPSSKDEGALARAVGVFVVHSFFSWWREE